MLGLFFFDPHPNGEIFEILHEYCSSTLSKGRRVLTLNRVTLTPRGEHHTPRHLICSFAAQISMMAKSGFSMLLVTITKIYYHNLVLVTSSIYYILLPSSNFPSILIYIDLNFHIQFIQNPIK